MAQQIERVHFIGVGGVGMSGIARVAHDQGMVVSGSDLRESRYTQQLREAGVEIFIGQAAENIPDNPAPDVIVTSTAILDNNPELIAAKARNLTIWHRARMLAQLGVGKKTIAIAGTHGKTTTSSMVASALDGIGADPTFLIGGIVRAYHTNAHSGAGTYYVVEADESDKSFTYLDPYAVLVTNVEADHLDHYNDLEEIHAKFTEFMSQVPDDGLLVVCADDEVLVSLAASTGKRMVTYGSAEGADAHIESWAPAGVGSTFTLKLPDGTLVEGSVKQNPGRHNVLNAVGTLTLLWGIGEDAQDVARSLSNFAGVRRRFDLVGEADGVTIVDDYAHHPTEIAATIAAAKKLDFKRVHVLFQPHRYSRVGLFTDVLRSEFAHAFDEADTAAFMDVYPAGETPVPGVNGKTFLDVLKDSSSHPALVYIPHRLDTVSSLLDMVEAGDLVLTMGAGDVTAVGPELLAALKARAGGAV